MYQDWHRSQKFNRKVLQYHDKHARQPKFRKSKAKLEQLKKVIVSQMRRHGFKCLRLVYKGSTYEGVKIMKPRGDCPEYDLDFVIRGGECLCAKPSHQSSDWCELRLKSNLCDYPEILNKVKEGERISPTRVMQLFYGALSRCSFIESYNVKLRHHGPAVQLDIHHPRTYRLWFKVDLAPTFYLEGSDPCNKFSKCFVAKSADDASLIDMWYKSNSYEERKLLDRASGQRKVVLRTLKAMRGHSSQLSCLKSYQMKMAHFMIMSKIHFDRDWTVNETGARLIDVLRYIHLCLETGHMPNHFNRNVNMLKLSNEARTNLKNYLFRLIMFEKSMFVFLGTGTILSQPVENPSVTETWRRGNGGGDIDDGDDYEYDDYDDDDEDGGGDDCDDDEDGDVYDYNDDDEDGDGDDYDDDDENGDGYDYDDDDEGGDGDEYNDDDEDGDGDEYNDDDEDGGGDDCDDDDENGDGYDYDDDDEDGDGDEYNDDDEDGDGDEYNDDDEDGGGNDYDDDDEDGDGDEYNDDDKDGGGYDYDDEDGGGDDYDDDDEDGGGDIEYGYDNDDCDDSGGYDSCIRLLSPKIPTATTTRTPSSGRQFRL